MAWAFSSMTPSERAQFRGTIFANFQYYSANHSCFCSVSVLSTSIRKKSLYMQKNRLCMASVRNQQNRLWNRLKILYSVLGCFQSFSVLLFLIAFVSALITLFGAFESYFYGLGSTVTHKKFFLFDTQKLPKNREFLVWDLFCNIDMGWEMGFEPTVFGTTIRRFNQLSYTHHIQ